MNEEKLKKNLEDKSLEIFTLLSHEIRTPLNAITGITGLLQNKGSIVHREEYYKILESTSENLLELVNNILDYSKLKKGDLKAIPKPFDLRKKLEHSLHSQKQTAKNKGLDFFIEIDPELPVVVLGDQVKIAQIFINLVSNAIKFTDKGEIRVIVELKEVKKDAYIVKCEVKDTGIGIASDQLANIFDAFHQGSEEININYAGSGLGLNISKDLVEMLGGRLKVKSELGDGSNFSFLLPLGRTFRGGNRNKKIGQTQNEKLKGKKVLLVEDNKINVLVGSRYLELWEMEYEVAINGKDALERIKTTDYDLVLMDIHMPKMDGLEAIEKIRGLPGEKYKKLPVIALTAVTQDPEKETSQTSFTDYLMKPFDSEELKELLCSHCN